MILRFILLALILTVGDCSDRKGKPVNAPVRRSEPSSYTPPSFVDVHDALDRWESITHDDGYRIRMACTAAVRKMAQRGDAAVIDRLMAIAAKSSAPASDEALRIACELADPPAARRIVRMVREELDRARAFGLCKNSPARGYSAILGAFVTRGRGASDLLDELEDHREIFLIAADVFMTQRNGYAGIAPAAARVMGQCRVSLSLFDARVSALIACRPRSRSVPLHLGEKLSPAAYPQLRALVCSESLPRRFCHGAADVLSHVGDLEIIPDLEALLPAWTEDEDATEEYLLYYLWRIQVQNPPEALLDFISSTTRYDFSTPRNWAVQRALTLGIEPARIREAILVHDRNAKHRLEKMDAFSQKHAGLELGILSKEDAPEIDLDRWRAVP